jgi:hypothetical protein
MITDTLFGVHTGDPAKAVTTYPGITVERVFIPGVRKPSSDLVELHTRHTAASVKAGLLPIVSFKLDPDEVLRGAWTAALSAYGEALHDLPQAWLVYWHEPENDMDAETFAAAFTEVRDTLHRTNSGLRVGYVAMAYQWQPGMRGGATRDPAPWRVAADFYGVDAYTGSRTNSDEPVWTHPGLRRWYDQIVLPLGAQDRWSVTERGFRGRRDARRAEAIAADAAGLSSLGSAPEAVVYWNTPGAEGDSALINGPLADRALARLAGTVVCTACDGTGRVTRPR